MRLASTFARAAASALQRPYASTEPLTITSSSLQPLRPSTNVTTFGPFKWRGGIELASANQKFGGLSGLIMTDECTSLRAVSDAGRWLTATVTYSGHAPTGLGKASIVPILDDKGKPPQSKRFGDAEAVAEGPNGKTIVGFESRTRVGAYDLAGKGMTARFQNLNPPKDIVRGRRNGELESVGYFRSGALKGHYIAVAETNLDAQGNTRAWVWNGKRSFAFSIRQLETYNITDIALLPDGDDSGSAAQLQRIDFSRHGHKPVSRKCHRAGQNRYARNAARCARALLRHRQYGGHCGLRTQRRTSSQHPV